MGWILGRASLRVAVGCVLVVAGAATALGQNDKLVITEFIPNPNGSDANTEWFEIYNAGSVEVDIDGWTLKDNDTDSHTIDDANGTTTIAPSTYLVLGRSTDMSQNGGATVDYPYGGDITLTNTNDEIVLTEAVNIVDVERARLNYRGTDWPTISSGRALVLTGTPDPDNYTAGALWCKATTATTYGTANNRGTPKAANGATGRETNGDCITTTAPPPPPMMTFTGKICEIQGGRPDGASPYEDDYLVTTNDNVVTAVGAGGFFIQTPTSCDNDVNTSDGIFVVHTGSPTVSVGDQVDVSGTIEEFFDFTRFASGATVTLDGTNQPLPAPVEFNSSRPSPNPRSPSCAIEYECYEGMRIRIATGTIGTGNQHFGSDPVAEMYITPTASRAFREPGIEYPGRSRVPVWDGNPEVFELDPDKLGLTNVSWVPGTTFSATGVLGYEFRDYEIWPTELTAISEAAALPRAVREKATGEITVASLNMYRLFASPRSNEPPYATRLDKFSVYIRDVLESPDVIAVQEVNTVTELTAVASEIQADDSSVVYTAYLEEGNDIGGIDSGFLVRSGVTVNSVTQHGKDEMWLDPSTSMNNELHDRPPLVLDAAVGDLDFTVIALHNRSLINIERERTQEKRLLQAQSVARLVESLQDSKVIVVGDYNAFQFSDGYVDVVGQIRGIVTPSQNVLSGPDLVGKDLCNLIDRVPAQEKYSFIFEGSAQALDHALVNQSLERHVVEMQYARGNADAVENNRDDATNSLYASDHDGFVVYLSPDAKPPVSPSPCQAPARPPGGVTSMADLTLNAESEVVSTRAVRYSVSVDNAGPGTASNVVVKSSFSGGVSIDTSTAGCAEDPRGVPDCTLGDILPDDSKSFTIDVDTGGPSEGSLMYSASIDSDAVDPGPDDDDVDIVQPLGPPNAPSDLVATAIGSTAIELRWRDNSRVETQFDVFLQGPGDPRPRLIKSLSANTTSTVVGDLVSNVTYSFVVEARNGLLRSARTPVSTATTWGDANLQIEADGRLVSEGLVRYTVSIRNAGPDHASLAIVTSSLVAAEGSFAASTSGCLEDPGGVPECSLDDIEVGETESFTIDVEIDAASRNSLTYSGAARDVAEPRPHDDTVEIVTPLGRPAAPSHLEAEAVGGMEVELQWRDNSGMETGFGVFLQGPGDLNMRMIGTVPANTTSTIVNELVPTVTYSFAVEALNGALRSERTPMAMATTWIAQAARCAEDDALCLGAFQVEVEWDDGKGRVGRGFAERLTADAGDFWFFHPANIELVVKVLNGCAMNDRYWVYAAGLTDVGVTMTVRDLRNGVEKSWTNPLGKRFRPITDSLAFATCDSGSSVTSQSRAVLSGAPRGRGEELYAASLSAADLIDSASSACAADDGALCLMGSRFEVRADWEAGGQSGVATAIPRTADTGMFWFFSSDNVELVVKVLDGCRENGYRWVLMGGLTDVGVEVTVTDSESGKAKMYRNLEGTPFATMFDVTAFACSAGP